MGRKMKRGKDRKVFSRTAAQSRKMNVSPKIMRGGTRL